MTYLRILPILLKYNDILLVLKLKSVFLTSCSIYWSATISCSVPPGLSISPRSLERPRGLIDGVWLLRPLIAAVGAFEYDQTNGDFHRAGPKVAGRALFNSFTTNQCS